jgi:DnaK suppressor protein
VASGTWTPAGGAPRVRSSGDGPASDGLLLLPRPYGTRPSPTKQLRVRREELEAERAQLLEQVAELDAEADVNNWREGGFDDDPADAGSASFERETAQSLSNHARRLLTQIDDALRRMDAGSYGTCESCGEQIEADRLEALPYATLCMTCKRREETGR